MTRTKLFPVVCAEAFLFLGAVSLAVAQAPGGGAAPGQATPQTNPGQMSRRGADSPLDQNTPMNTSTKVDDKKFVKDAAEGGMAEVELGKLAAQKATNPDVKQFGQKMVDDHSKANDKLKDVASQESIEIPAALGSKYQSRIDKLSKLSGDKFDKAYVKDQLKDHENDVKEFQAEAQNGQDPKVKSFASETLPTLQEHLELVKNLNKTQKGTDKTAKGL
jgi:putative membrane protein